VEESVLADNVNTVREPVRQWDVVRDAIQPLWCGRHAKREKKHLGCCETKHQAK